MAADEYENQALTRRDEDDKKLDKKPVSTPKSNSPAVTTSNKFPPGYRADPYTTDTLQQTPVIGSAITPASTQVLNTNGPPPATSPLSTQGLVAGQVGSAEERKYLTSQLAEQQAQGLNLESNIGIQGAAENAANLEDQRQSFTKAKSDVDYNDNALRLKIGAMTSEQNQVDPNRVWKNAGTGGQITAALGMILGGFGQGAAHLKSNPAIDVLNNIIDRDVDAQKANIANNWKQIAATHELDDNAFNREIHNQTWKEHYRLGALETVKMQLASNASKTQSQVVRQNALVGIQDLSDQQDKVRNNLYIMGQQAQMANLARQRKLMEEAGKSVEELVNNGATQEAATQSVYTRPEYQELLHAGIAPAPVLHNVQLQSQLQGEVAQAKANAAKIGLKPGTPAYDAVIQQPLQNPVYAPLLQQMNQGQVVPQNKLIEQQNNLAKDARERTVTINGQQYMANSSKEAEEAATAVNSAKEVLRINQRIKEIVGTNVPSGPSERAELDSLLDQGALHFPRMQTGSARVNDTEIQMGKDTYTGKGDWLRTDLLGRKRGHLESIDNQAKERIADAANGLQSLGKMGPGGGGPGIAGIQPQTAKPTVQQMNQILGATPVKR